MNVEPSDLAERRPDLKAAESRFRAAFYNVAVARKARLPSISLQAGIGYVDESLLDENGKLCLEKAKLIVYSHGEYLALGKKLGTFGYSVRKKKPVRRKK